MTPPGPLGAKMTEEMAKSRISAPLNGVWGGLGGVPGGVPGGPRRIRRPQSVNPSVRGVPPKRRNINNQVINQRAKSRISPPLNGLFKGCIWPLGPSGGPRGSQGLLINDPNH